MTGGDSQKEFNDDRDSVLRALGDSQTPIHPPPPPQNFAPQDDLIRRFANAAQENDATTELLSDISAVPDAAAAYLRARSLPLTAVCTDEWRELSWRKSGMQAHFRAPLESDICGVSGVVAAAADCGAMSICGGETHELTVGLLPPHHIAIVREEQIRPSLSRILQTPRGGFALFCGPSRTADIEQTLTLGAHGPLSVHILIVKNGGGD